MPKKQTRAHTKTQTTIIQCKQQRITTTIITLPFENEPDSLLNEREVAPKKDMQERSWNTHSLKHSNSMCTVDIDWGQPLHTKAHTYTHTITTTGSYSFVCVSLIPCSIYVVARPQPFVFFVLFCEQNEQQLKHAWNERKKLRVYA